MGRAYSQDVGTMTVFQDGAHGVRQSGDQTPIQLSIQTRQQRLHQPLPDSSHWLQHFFCGTNRHEKTSVIWL
jgi:hypothetical protein